MESIQHRRICEWIGAVGIRYLMPSAFGVEADAVCPKVEADAVRPKVEADAVRPKPKGFRRFIRC